MGATAGNTNGPKGLLQLNPDSKVLDWLQILAKLVEFSKENRLKEPGVAIVIRRTAKIMV